MSLQLIVEWMGLLEQKMMVRRTALVRRCHCKKERTGFGVWCSMFLKESVVLPNPKGTRNLHLSDKGNR